MSKQPHSSLLSMTQNTKIKKATLARFPRSYYRSKISREDSATARFPAKLVP
jgi:hypothetical protein